MEHGWRPRSQRAVLEREGLQAFARKALKQRKPSLKQLTESIGPAPEASPDSVIDALQIGHATWRMIGDCLCSERDSRFTQGDDMTFKVRGRGPHLYGIRSLVTRFYQLYRTAEPSTEQDHTGPQSGLTSQLNDKITINAKISCVQIR